MPGVTSGMASVAFSPVPPRRCAQALGGLDLFDGDLGLGGAAHAGRDGAAAACAGRALAAAVVGFLVGDDRTFEGFVADVAFQAGVVVLVLAEEARASSSWRGAGASFSYEVAAVMAVAGRR